MFFSVYRLGMLPSLRHRQFAALYCTFLMLAAVVGPELHRVLLHHGHADEHQEVGWQHADEHSGHDAHTCAICSLTFVASLPDGSPWLVAVTPSCEQRLESTCRIATREFPANRTRGPPAFLPICI